MSGEGRSDDSSAPAEGSTDAVDSGSHVDEESTESVGCEDGAGATDGAAPPGDDDGDLEDDGSTPVGGDEDRPEDPEALAATIEERERRIEELETTLEEREEEIDDLTARLKRSKADFQNYKKRMKKREDELRRRATEELVERLLDVRDNLSRAVDREYEEVEAIREGVKMTLSELDRVLDGEDVERIEPEPGESVDPHRHEVMMRVDSDQPPDAIANVYAPGYEMGDRLLRPAQVTVSEGPGDADDHDGDDERTDSQDESVTDGEDPGRTEDRSEGEG